jgi:plastocyanin
MKHQTRLAWMVMFVAGGAACGGGGGGGGGGGPPPTIAIAKAGSPSGDAQTATVNSTLPQDLRVLVTEDALPKVGATVQWSATSGTVLPTSSPTGADGIATTTWTLGHTAGSLTASASLSGATGSPVTFTATATAGPAANLQLSQGNSQTELINAAFPTALQVLVTDQFANPVAGVTVDWVASGSASVAAATSVSNAQGIAAISASATATPGSGQVTASVAGIVGSVPFLLTAAAARISTGNTFFRSAGNATQNPAVDTVAATQTVLWVNGSGSHTVQSTGASAFPSSGTLTRYAVQFNNTGTYQYDCAVHGTAMTGRIVVQ